MKIVKNETERLAYVNFAEQNAARKARKAHLQKLAGILGRHLRIDPAGVVRDQSGRYLKNEAQHSPPHMLNNRYGGPPMRGPGGGHRERSPNQQRRGGSNQWEGGRGQRDNRGRRDNRQSSGGRQRSRSPVPRPPKLDLDQFKQLESVETQATRTLFLGNLPREITREHLHDIFGRYGIIEEIDIKTPQDSNAAYGFVCFEVRCLLIRCPSESQ